MSLRVLLCVVAITVCFYGCEEEPQKEPDLDDATLVVERFLTAELAPRRSWGKPPETYVYGCEGDYQPSTDTQEPVYRARILGSTPRADTVLVSVEYVVLGWAYLDRLRGSDFWKEVHADTVLFRVVRDTTSRLRVFCGPHPVNHYGMEAMAEFVAGFDERSLRDWAAAVQSAEDRFH